MEIHHYTSIENLALILKNKTIRFTRLDKVDDSEEAGLSCKNIQLSYYTFVSCWTDSEEESIPLWKMYAGKEMHGIRIELLSNLSLLSFQSAVLNFFHSSNIHQLHKTFH